MTRILEVTDEHIEFLAEVLRRVTPFIPLDARATLAELKEIIGAKQNA